MRNTIKCCIRRLSGWKKSNHRQIFPLLICRSVCFDAEVCYEMKNTGGFAVKKILLPMVVLGTLGLLAGCGSSRYVVVTEDYTIHVAASKPEIDPALDTVMFEDERGEKVSIPRADLKKMLELKN